MDDISARERRFEFECTSDDDGFPGETNASVDCTLADGDVTVAVTMWASNAMEDMRLAIVVAAMFGAGILCLLIGGWVVGLVVCGCRLSVAS